MNKIKSLFLIPFFLFWNVFALAMDSDPDENIHVNLNEIRAYSEAIINGVGDALVNLVDDICHPIDNIILPVTDLIHDSAVIAAKHAPTTPELLIMQDIIKRNPQIYSASARRMQERINEINTTANFLSNASGPERVRALVSMGTTIYVPGKVFTATRSVIKNVKTFGTPMPPRFHTASSSLTLEPVNKLSLHEIRNIPGEEFLMYVVNKDRELIITYQTYDHWHLGRGKPAYAAGDIYIKDGKITRVDSRSGSYEPSGSHLGGLVEEVFKREGFIEVPGKFVDWQAEFQSFLQKHKDYVFDEFDSLSRNQSAGITTRFDAPSPVGMIFGVYLLKNNRITDPRFQLANSLNLGFSCEALSWHEMDVEYINQGRTLLEAGQYEASKKTFEEALRLRQDSNFANQPQSADIFALIGSCYEKQGHTDDARRHYDHALYLNPGLATAYAQRANQEFQLGNFSEALQLAKKATQLNPSAVETWALQGFCCNNLGQVEDARRYLNHALYLNPGLIEQYTQQGYHAFQAGNYPEAMKFAQRVKELDPTSSNIQSADALALMGFCYEKMGYTGDAHSYYGHALYLNPRLITEYMQKVNQAFQVGNYNEVVQLVEKIRQLYPNFLNDPSAADTFALLGASYDKLGRTDDARDYFAHAQYLKPPITEPVAQVHSPKAAKKAAKAQKKAAKSEAKAAKKAAHAQKKFAKSDWKKYLDVAAQMGHLEQMGYTKVNDTYVKIDNNHSNYNAGDAQGWNGYTTSGGIVRPGVTTTELSPLPGIATSYYNSSFNGYGNSSSNNSYTECYNYYGDRNSCLCFDRDGSPHKVDKASVW